MAEEVEQDRAADDQQPEDVDLVARILVHEASYYRPERKKSIIRARTLRILSFVSSNIEL